MRSTELHTKADIAAALSRRGSVRVFVATAIVVGATRLFVGGGFGRGDLVVLVVTIIIAGPVEWIIHKFLLHADEDAWTNRVLGIGAGHRQHHLDPPDVDWLMLRWTDAAVFIFAFGAITAAWSLPVLWLMNAAALGPFLTAWTLAAIGLAHYEFVHLLVHTPYRCRMPYYARLARNHRRHHYRNERYWMGVTTNSGDRLMRTYPASMTDVPLTGTARTLGVETPDSGE